MPVVASTSRELPLRGRSRHHRYNQGSAGSAANLSLGNANHFNWTTTDLINFGDVLTADTTDLEDTGISASYDSANGRLTLTKAEGGSAEEFQRVLRGISFSNSTDALILHCAR